MAEGYLKQTPTNKPPERLGHEYFDKLLSRSFFQYAPNDKSFFVMHDLMNDMAKFVAGEYFLRFDKTTEEPLAKYRHMSFVRETCVAFQNLKRTNSLRTLLSVFVGVEHSWEQFYLSSKILDDFILQLPLLRVLSLSRFNITEVPVLLGTLKHLRYLNLSRTSIKELPENIGDLYSLQTLIVFGCENLTKLPKSFAKLKNLRHFDIKETPLLRKLPLGIGELRSLRTLTKIIIGGEDGFEITELKGLPNLHGEISIEGLQNVQSAMQAREANLSLRRLTKLEMKWDDGSQSRSLEQEVLNELKPHIGTLNNLGIEFYGGIRFPAWVGDKSFQKLGYVSIRGCRKCTSLPSLGQLPPLKELFIQGMDEVKVIGSELTQYVVVAFPSLEILGLEDMLGWEVWSTNSKDFDIMFPCLRELRIKNCPKLSNVSLDALPLLKVLEIHGCGDGVIRSLVCVASSNTKLKIISTSGLTDEVWRGIIKYLGVVENLTIKKCNELRYLWESEAEASKAFVSLKELVVRNCNNLMRLGEKEEDDHFGNNLLSHLRLLEVNSCRKIERCCCPNNIENLMIIGCKSLKHLSFPTIPTQKGGQKLKSLHVINCKKLRRRINITHMPMIESVVIQEWKSLKSITQLSNFTHVIILTIHGCLGIKTFPDIHLSNLTLLKRLTVVKCPNLDASFPRGLWPPNLVSLYIGGLGKSISEWGLQNFPSSLVELALWCEPHVTNFCELAHLLPSSLTTLQIREFDNLESLSMGLQHLASLQSFFINTCAKMNHLPETLSPSLLRLGIVKCPKLAERCNGRGSHYWPRISHIPEIRII